VENSDQELGILTAGQGCGGDKLAGVHVRLMRVYLAFDAQVVRGPCARRAQHR
jgi:hypothetical protein